MRTIVLVICLTSCGVVEQSKNESAEPTDERYALAVEDEESKPACNSGANGRLIYVVKDEQFQYCSDDKWVDIQIGMKVASKWRYHLDSLGGAQNIASEGAGVDYRIGTVGLVVFSDGSGFLTVFGTGVDEAATEFSHSFFLDATEDEQTLTAKITTYENTRVRYLVRLREVPTFKAVVDTDGNFANNTDISLELTKQK